jgi:hypothetical protein
MNKLVVVSDTSKTRTGWLQLGRMMTFTGCHRAHVFLKKQIFGGNVVNTFLSLEKVDTRGHQQTKAIGHFQRSRSPICQIGHVSSLYKTSARGTA